MSSVVSIIKVTFTSNYKGCHRLFWRKPGQAEYNGPVFANPECSGSGNPCSITFSDYIDIEDPVEIDSANVVFTGPNYINVSMVTVAPHNINPGDYVNICNSNPAFYNQENVLVNVIVNPTTFVIAYNGVTSAPAYVDSAYVRETPNIGTLTFEGYVQACCEDEESLEGRIPWTTTYTPDVC